MSRQSNGPISLLIRKKNKSYDERSDNNDINNEHIVNNDLLLKHFSKMIIEKKIEKKTSFS